MTKRERIQAVIEGKRADRIPYSLWSHLPDSDLDAVKLADATWDFYKKLNIDFIKTMNNGMYAIEDYGCTIDFSDITKGGIAKVVNTPVKTIDDWKNIPELDPESGALGRELHSLELLLEKRKKENDDVPVIFTVFSPLTIADKLSGKCLLEHIKQGGADNVKAAMNRITESTERFIHRLIERGADGIFLASQMSSYKVMEEEDFLEYGAPYDKRLLVAASKGWCNAIHCHGEQIMFDVLNDYPVHAFNWHIWETLPDLEEGIALTGKCIMGGIARMDITNRNKNSLRNQIFHTIRATGGEGLILTPGCVVRHPLDYKTLNYIQETKNLIEKALLK